MIAVIVPFSRPQMVENVRANFERQRVHWGMPGPILLVVENGPGVGAWEREVRSGYVVQSETGRAHARTAGLHLARELECEWFAFWDDDDWYAPGFLEFMCTHRERADAIGLSQHVLEDPTGKRWLMRYRDPGPVPATELVGGLAPATLFGRVDRAVDWTAHVPFSEEIFWFTDMVRAGRSLFGLEEPDPSSPLFVLKRYPDPAHGHAIPWEHEKQAARELPC